MESTTTRVSDYSSTFREMLGVEIPIMEFPQNYERYVPEIDADYCFSAWKAERKFENFQFVHSAKDLISIILENYRILLIGPPACGKTSIITQFAAIANWPIVRINGNRDITTDDFIGTYEIKNGETNWAYGPLAIAMKMGAILILDEVDHMPAECSSILHSVLEHGGKLIVNSHGGEIINPHKNFRIIATANTLGFGDDSGNYAAAQVQDAAFLSRWEVVMHVAYMEAKAEQSLLKKINPDISDDTANKLVSLANDSRTAFHHGDLTIPVTVRQTMTAARLMKTFPTIDAITLAIIGKLNYTDSNVLLEILYRYFGEGLSTED